MIADCTNAFDFDTWDTFEIGMPSASSFFKRLKRPMSVLRQTDRS